MIERHITLPHAEIARFCQQHHIRKLSLFGSVLRDDFRPDSDIDVLVEFEPGYVPGLLRMAGMQIEFSALLEREVGFLTKEFIHLRILHSVVDSAVTIYE